MELAIAAIAFVAAGALIPHFLDPANLLNVVRQSSIIGICAVGMTFVIMVKDIDLSFAGIMSFCPMIAGVLMLQGMPIEIALLAGVGLGAIAGGASGLLVSRLAVPSFITTLVIGQIAQGLALLVNEGRSIGGFPASYVFLGNGSAAGIPISDYILLLALAVGLVVQNQLPLGNHIRALGGNELVLRQEGISVPRIKVIVFAMSGMLAAISGMLLSAQLDTVHPTQGEAYQLDAIAACIIGGVDLAGGIGSVGMAVVGAVVIGLLRNALNLLGIHPFIQNVLVGTLIISIVFVGGVARRKAESATRGTL